MDLNQLDSEKNQSPYDKKDYKTEEEVNPDQ